VLAQLRQLSRAAICRRAQDRTATTATQSALVIAPHPDDETLGCGATIARKLAAGGEVTVLILTDGRHCHRSAVLSAEEVGRLRRAEAQEAMRRLGLTDGQLRWGDLPDGSLAGNHHRLVRLIRSVLGEVGPDEVYVTAADEPHADHAAAGRAAREAVAGVAAALLEYPVWLWGAWPLRRQDRIRSASRALRFAAGGHAQVVRGGPFQPVKQEALRAYASQLSRPVGVPAGESWPVLPATVLRTAAQPLELFLPVPR
jgi:LmbE family N-acetylglucosaminyl deacetylase